MWIEAIEAKFEGKGKPFEREDWDQLLGHCMVSPTIPQSRTHNVARISTETKEPKAVTDTPCTVFYQELLAAYPDAKVILGVRDSAEQ